MLIDLLLLAVGAALVIKGSDYFVDASVEIARRAGLPRVVIGGTLVSLATTTPEIAVSVIAGIEKSPGLAVGNALGSVAFNTGFILALVALFGPVKTVTGGFRWRSALLLGLTFLLFIMTLDLSLPRWRGLLLLAIGIIYLVFNYYRGRYSQPEVTADQKLDSMMRSVRRTVLFFCIGAAMVILGSRLLVTSGTSIAGALGVPPIFIGLTLIALGTSLPELVTAIASMRKGVADLSVGNLFGANVLNVTIVTGIAASIAPLGLERVTQLYTFPAILVILGVFFLAVRSSNQLTRREGVLLIALYLAFIAGLAIFNFAG